MNQTVRLGYGKISKTGNEIDKLNELKNHNSKFKSKIKAPNNKVTQENYDYEGDDKDELEDSGDQFCGKQSREMTPRSP